MVAKSYILTGFELKGSRHAAAPRERGMRELGNEVLNVAVAVIVILRSCHDLAEVLERLEEGLLAEGDVAAGVVCVLALAVCGVEHRAVRAAVDGLLLGEAVDGHHEARHADVLQEVVDGDGVAAERSGERVVVRAGDVTGGSFGTGSCRVLGEVELLEAGGPGLQSQGAHGAGGLGLGDRRELTVVHVLLEEHVDLVVETLAL